MLLGAVGLERGNRVSGGLKGTRATDIMLSCSHSNVLCMGGYLKMLSGPWE